MLNKKYEKNIIKDKLQRNSSIELLRIISMVLITFHHFACHGNFNWGGVLAN